KQGSFKPVALQARRWQSQPRRGCEGDGRLLKFNVCRDAAVCAVSAGGFFSVWDDVRKRRSGDRLIGLTPLELFSSVTAVRKHAPRRFWPLRKGDYEWQNMMWRLSGVVRAAMWRRSVQANLV